MTKPDFPPHVWIDDHQLNEFSPLHAWDLKNDCDSHRRYALAVPVEFISIQEANHMVMEAKIECYEEAAKSFECAGETAISLAYKDKAAKLRRASHI